MFTKAVIMKYQKLRGLKQQKCVSSGGQQSETKVVASHTLSMQGTEVVLFLPCHRWLRCPLACGPALQAHGGLLRVPSHSLPSMRICFSVQIFLFKGTSYRIRANLHYLILT